MLCICVRLQQWKKKKRHLNRIQLWSELNIYSEWIVKACLVNYFITVYVTYLLIKMSLFREKVVFLTGDCIYICLVDMGYLYIQCASLSAVCHCPTLSSHVQCCLTRVLAPGLDDNRQNKLIRNAILRPNEQSLGGCWAGWVRIQNWSEPAVRCR